MTERGSDGQSIAISLPPRERAADKILIAGSRTLNPTIAQISNLITRLPDVLICGCADGVDKAGYTWARHFSVPVEFFPAWAKQRDWALSVRKNNEVVHPLPSISSRAAGFARNGSMSGIASRALIIWTGESPGTRNMRDLCLGRNIPCTVRRFIMKDNHCVPE